VAPPARGEGEEREDEMVAAFDFCLHGRGAAAPSIDTAMHGLVTASHVDHLHPDSGIAVATAADGERLTKEIYGDRVVWVPWRRPGFQLGLDIAAVHDARPDAVGVILGGHGITAVRLPSLSTITLATGNPSFVNARRNLRTSVSLNLRGPRLITHLSDQPPRAPGGRPARRQGRLRVACR